MPTGVKVAPATLVAMRKVLKGGIFEGEEEVRYLARMKPRLRPYYVVLKGKPDQFLNNLQKLEADWDATRARKREAAASVVAQAASGGGSGQLESPGGSVAVLEAEEGVAEGGDSGTIRALDQIDTFIEQWEHEHGKEEPGGGG